MVYILDDLSYFFVNTAWDIFGDSMHSTLTRLARTSNLYTSGGFLRICFPLYSDSNTHNHLEEDTPTIMTCFYFSFGNLYIHVHGVGSGRFDKQPEISIPDSLWYLCYAHLSSHKITTQKHILP